MTAPAGRRLARRLRPLLRPLLQPLLRPHPWRLGTGLVLFAFALSHFLNHALGLVSLDAMEAAQAVRSAVWGSPAGTALLYGSLAVHAALGVASTLRRRSWRLPFWQLAQVGLGLAIPVLGAGHLMRTRGLAAIADQDDSYRYVIASHWPDAAFVQALFLLAVWVHGSIGIRMWLRERPWYPRLAPVLLTAATLVPALALAGWSEVAGRLPFDAPDAHARPPLPPEVAALPGLVARGAWIGLGTVVALILALRLLDRLRRGPALRYAGGAGDGRAVRLRSGATILETSLAAGIPHASACGGRGRCTTCRVAVIEGEADLPAPNATEAAALARVHAPPGVRLACQVRPTAPLSLRLLVPASGVLPHLPGDPARWGVERRITVLFADLRGFTGVAERLYPYDAVFLLNRYFELMGAAIERHGGAVDKFLGDGIMALFGTGLGTGAARAARDGGAGDGLRAAQAMLAALVTLNEEFQGTLREPLRMGIGLHTGPVVLGRIGGREGGATAPALTALGDTVNVASRLEALNKEFGSVLVVSGATLDAAGLAIPGAVRREVPVRGRAEALSVAVADAVPLLQPAGQPAPALA